MKKLFFIFIFLFFAFCTQAQQSSFVFPFMHNGHNFKRSVIQPGAIFQHTTATQKVVDANLLGIKLVRTSVSFYSWNGTNSPESDTITAHGLQNALNINAIATGGADLTTVDTGAWAANLTVLAAHTDPAKVVWVIWNEPGNMQYYSISTPTDLLPYIQCLKIAVRIGHQHGFKVYDGGITPGALVYWTHRQMSIAHDPDTTNFLNNCIPIAYQARATARNGTTINQEIANTDYLFTQYATIGIDGLMLHFYTPFVKFFVDTATNYTTSYTGIPQICKYLRMHITVSFYCNEFGNVDAAYMPYALADMRRCGVRMVVYYNDPTQSFILTVIDEFDMLTNPFGNNFKTQIQ